MSGRGRNELVLVGCVDDGLEGFRFEGSAADQTAVDVELCKQTGSVFGVHGAAVLDRDGAGRSGTEEGADGVTDERADFAGLRDRCRFAGADGPDGFVGDDDLADLIRLDVLERSAVTPDSRSARDSPTQTIGRRPTSSAFSSFLLTVSSVSLKYWRRSLWPMMTYLTPISTSISAETSPV